MTANRSWLTPPSRGIGLAASTTTRELPCNLPPRLQQATTNFISARALPLDSQRQRVYNRHMIWWQQPFFQVALPIMIAIVLGTWYQCKRIERMCDSINRWPDENEKRMDATERRPSSA